MIAAISIPVIGVPIKSLLSEWTRFPSFYCSNAPGGARCNRAINGAKNAGILACQIVGTRYKEIGDKVNDYKKKLNREINLKDASFRKLGTEKYTP